MFNAVDIHIPDAKFAVRAEAEGRGQGGRCGHGLRIR
ncbi:MULTISPECIES: DUF5431 family protein [Enterobacteriaceae]|nr:DUF5431 family protein [Cronobacter sakazakii]